jgi:hypothetical protein
MTVEEAACPTPPLQTGLALRFGQELVSGERGRFQTDLTDRITTAESSVYTAPMIKSVTSERRCASGTAST